MKFQIHSIITFLFTIVCFSAANAQTPDSPIRACGKVIFGKSHPVEMSEVRSGLKAIKYKCRKGVAVDEKNKPIIVVQNYCPSGMPPNPDDKTDYFKIRQQEIAEQRKKYRVITYSCYPPRM